MNAQQIKPTESEMLSEMTREMGWDIFYDQLDRGRFDGIFEFSEGRHSQLMRERYSRAVCIHGAVPKGMATFIIVTPCTNRASFCGEAVTPQTICALMPGDEGALNVPPGRSFLTCCMDAELLDNSLRELHGASLAEVLPRTGPIEAPSGDAERLRTVIQTACGTVPDAGQILDHRAAEAAVEKMALAALHGVLTCKGRVLSSPLAARNHWRCVRMARQFIEAHLGSALPMEMLCRHTGVSERTLETAFREVTGHRPLQFIRTRRLNLARHKLMKADAREISVKEVALTCGFWHLGYFARDYLALFGELPSRTLRNSNR